MNTNDVQLDMTAPANSIMLCNGAYYCPLEDPVDVSMVTPEVLAYGLAGISRFAAHVRPRTNVACHSYHVSIFAECVAASFGEDPFMASLQGLLHDASDALGFGDIPGHLKRHPAYAGVWAAEKRTQEAIYQRWNLPVHKMKSVEEADKRMQATEMVLCMPRRAPKVDPYPGFDMYGFMQPVAAEAAWLRQWLALELEASRRGIKL